uniref:Uncharacterized protein n=1 Tax=Plectus sambesii TaxID=2011161 RepID=A0A914V413_9BILA
MPSFKPSKELISAVQQAATMAPDGRKYIDIPYVLATEENLAGFAKFVALDDKSEKQVNCVKWPSPNGRPVDGGMGGGFDEDEFVFRWTDDGVCRAETENVQGGFACGNEKDGAIWAMEANNHPDSDQIFWPLDGQPMIVVLSKHADEATVDPRTFAAFYLDGTKGINVLAGVYHLVAFPVASKSAKVLSKQRK